MAPLPQPDATKPASAARFPLFDSLRGIAALLILIIHSAGFSLLAGEESLTADFVNQLAIAVVIFFVVSGFLLYRPFALARAEGRPVPSLLAYGWRRVLRVVPAYWLALTAVVLIVAGPAETLPTGATRDIDYVTYFLFGQIYRDFPLQDFPAFPQAWSVCVEVSYYVALPLIVLAARALPARTPRAWFTSELVLLGALFFGSLAFRAFVLPRPPPGASSTARCGSARRCRRAIDALAAGMLLAVLSVAWRDRELPRWIAWIDRFPGIAWAIALAAYVAVSTLLGLHGFMFLTPADDVAQHLLFVIGATALVAPAVFGDQSRGLVRRFLATRALLFVGTVSYGFYLYQFPGAVRAARARVRGRREPASVRDRRLDAHGDRHHAAARGAQLVRDRAPDPQAQAPGATRRHARSRPGREHRNPAPNDGSREQLGASRKEEGRVPWS